MESTAYPLELVTEGECVDVATVKSRSRDLAVGGADVSGPVGKVIDNVQSTRWQAILELPKHVR